MKLRCLAAGGIAVLASFATGHGQSVDGDGPGAIAGISLESEYLVFVIDTSGSMQQYAWDDVIEHFRATLAAYPALRGIQVLNDEGFYLLERGHGEWLPYSPALQAQILDALPEWRAFSESRPDDGIVKAIETFYDPAKRISLYIYSDDFARGSVESTLAAIERINRVNDQGGRKVRINAVAFPVYYEEAGSLLSSANYAVLMRELCQRNGGTFIALTPR